MSVVSDNCQSLSTQSQSWLFSVIGDTLSNRTLLYKHYILKEAFSRDIGFDKKASSIHQLMGSTLNTQVTFSYLTHGFIWPSVSAGNEFVNSLRGNQAKIADYLYALSMQEDVSNDPPWSDQGKLFSLSVLYALYLVNVIVNYELVVDPHPGLFDISKSLQDTLTQLKGAICRGENHWH